MCFKERDIMVKLVGKYPSIQEKLEDCQTYIVRLCYDIETDGLLHQLSKIHIIYEKM